MNRHLCVGTLLWWSLRRAVRAYGVPGIMIFPLGLGLLWLVLSVAVRHDEWVKPWPFYTAIAATAVFLTLWRIVADGASGFTENLAWHGQNAKCSTLCALGAHALLCGAQAALLAASIRLLGGWIG